MTKQERSAYWRSLVSKQNESGLSAAAFCREHRINRDRFYHWRRRFQDEEANNTHLGAFVELVPYQRSASAGVHIRLRNGLCIEVERGFDPVTLRATIQTLCQGETRSC
jgi:transposase-like protein